MKQIYYLLSGLRWQDVLDILLNSYILFRLYVLFRGTRVIRALLAICVFWAAGQAAVSLGLIITNWAMQGIITVAALVIIIIFRNEIATVLQARDLKSFFWGIPRYQFMTPIRIVVESVNELAQKKIGALIILPLKHGVASVVRGGIPIEGKLTQELLTGIFWDKNPLHDGAVVIQGGRIISAGNILPLSTRDDLPPFFGTRHRAGLGLSEQTDAVAIVVSEERGMITLFRENRIHNIDSRAELEELLREHAGDESEKKAFLPRKIRHAAVAVLCLLCVTGLWFNFSRGMETFATYEVPVEFVNPEKKMEIISTSASSIKLLISGARPLINAVRPEQINIKLNLSKSVVGLNRMSVTRENILLPPGIQLKKIEPSELEINLDSLIEKELPVQPNWVGKLPGGLIMKSAVAIPSKVMVTGGWLVLKDVSTVFTEQIRLDRITESGSVSVNLAFEPASLKLKGSDKIQIRYHVEKKAEL